MVVQLLIFFLSNILSKIIKRNWGSCNQSIYDYLELFFVYNNHWSFLQLFIAFCCAYNYTITNL